MSNWLHILAARAVDASPDDVQLTIRPPLDYQSNRLYDLWIGSQHLILKEYRKPQEYAQAPMREFQALELLAPLSIAPSPLLLQNKSHSPIGPVVIYEYMEGQMWDRRKPSPTELEALARVWLRLHPLKQEGLWLSRGYEHPLFITWERIRGQIKDYLAWISSTISAPQEIAGLCNRALEKGDIAARELMERRAPLCFCRADARFANVISRPNGQIGLVDWEDSGLRDPARDVADLLTHPNQEDLLTPHEWQAFLQPYLADWQSADPDLSRRVELYLLILPLFWLATFLHQGIQRATRNQLDGWLINGLPPYLRLRRYLARALAWPDTDSTAHLNALAGLKLFPGSLE